MKNKQSFSARREAITRVLDNLIVSSVNLVKSEVMSCCHWCWGLGQRPVRWGPQCWSLLPYICFPAIFDTMKTCKKSEIIQGTFGICTKERHDFSPSTGGGSVTSHQKFFTSELRLRSNEISCHQAWVQGRSRCLHCIWSFRCLASCFVGEEQWNNTEDGRNQPFGLCRCWNCCFWCWNWWCWWKGCFCRWWFWWFLWHFCTLLPRCCTKECSSLLHDNLNFQSLRSPPQFWKFMYIRWCKEHSTVYNRRLSWLGNFLSNSRLWELHTPGLCSWS